MSLFIFWLIYFLLGIGVVWHKSEEITCVTWMYIIQNKSNNNPNVVIFIVKALLVLFFPILFFLK